MALKVPHSPVWVKVLPSEKTEAEKFPNTGKSSNKNHQLKPGGSLSCILLKLVWNIYGCLEQRLLYGVLVVH